MVIPYFDLPLNRKWNFKWGLKSVVYKTSPLKNLLLLNRKWLFKCKVSKSVACRKIVCLLHCIFLINMCRQAGVSNRRSNQKFLTQNYLENVSWQIVFHMQKKHECRIVTFTFVRIIGSVSHLVRTETKVCIFKHFNALFR